MKITFLSHSGFAVDTGSSALLFDYCPRHQKSKADPILQDVLQGRRPLVFVSHVHRDHYTEDIYGLDAAGYFVGEGVPVQKNAVLMKGGDVWQQGGLTVRAYPSTDEGAAFLVETGGLRVFHAGDLNWWYWPGEPDPWNPDMEAAFKAYTAPLLDQQIDLAFLCADPRQRDGWLYGFDYLMRNACIRHAVPMHFWNQKSAPRKVSEAVETEAYRDRLILLSQLGEQAEI